ncbi:hypothetical protein NQ314_005896 [Rhamnusium bicolor]|uniref:Proteasome assembly chaperone 1 n=1 Tax=Rhamnusium bicolor TaxID=1586634 RepID=A0AAV8ZD95_9CUCU|nr:hypothetical protein NQ314_005896 [Rhamnusium bicolor]
MVFGEIIEPSTRALIDEDLEEYPEFIESIPKWEGNLEVPQEIETLIFIETEKVLKLFENCVLEEEKVFSEIINAGIKVYNVHKNKYIVVFSEKKELSCGEITELFDKWITTAQNIFTITSESICNYQNISLSEKPVSLIRFLSNNVSETFGYNKLESPNLVSGLGASVLSYCIYLGLPCTLFIAYVDTSPLDSVNMGPVLNLLKRIKLTVKSTKMKITSSSSNLYM